MNKYELKVKVETVGETKEFGDGGFKKRELITTVEENGYTNYFVFEFIQDKVDLLDTVLPGTDVTVHFNIRCRKVEKNGDDLYFTSLSGWKVVI